MNKAFWSFLMANMFPIWLVFIFSCFALSDVKSRTNCVKQEMQSALEKDSLIVQNHQIQLLQLQKKCDEQQEQIEDLNKRIDSMYNSIIGSFQNINRK